MTWAVWPEGHGEFTVHLPDGTGVSTLRVEDDGEVRMTLEGVARPQVLRVHRQEKPGTVLRDGIPLVEGRDWRHDVRTWKLSITNRAAMNAGYTVRRAH